MPDALTGLLQDIEAGRKIRNEINEKPRPHRKARIHVINDRCRDKERRRDNDLDEFLLWLHLILVIIIVVIRLSFTRLSWLFVEVHLHRAPRPLSRIHSGFAVRTSAHSLRLFARLLQDGGVKRFLFLSTHD